MEKKNQSRVQSGKNREQGEIIRVQPEINFRNSYPADPIRYITHHSSNVPTPSQHDVIDPCSVEVSSRKQPHPPYQPKPSKLNCHSSRTGNILSTGPRLSKRLSRRLQPPPSFKKDAHWLLHPDMTLGQKIYANSIARVYDMTNMKQLKQAQGVQLICREQQRAIDFFSPENYRKYVRYLHSHRIRPFGVSAPPSVLSRQKPAHPMPVVSFEEQDLERCKIPAGSLKEFVDIREGNKPVEEKFDSDWYPVPKKLTKRDKKSPKKYWIQPDPPTPETEPNGDGLIMDSEKHLDLKGEVIQNITRE